MLGSLTKTGEGNIQLTKQDVNLLTAFGLVGGTIIRHDESALPLVLRISKQPNKVRGEGFPQVTPWEKKKGYIFEILSRHLETIAAGKTIALEFPAIMLRKIFISHENTF